MADSIIKRRLKSLAQRRADEQAAKERARARARERREQGFVPQPAIVLPLDAYYAREPAFEAERARFYTHCARIFGLSGWHLHGPSIEMAAEIGYGDRERDVQRLGSDSAANIDIMAAPVEWLVAKRRLETREDESGIGLVRYSVALRLRDTWSGADIAGLKSQDVEASGGGGGGRLPSDYKIDCIKALAGLRRAMSPHHYTLLEAVVARDEWVWERRKTPAARLAVILELHVAIDHAALRFGLISTSQFVQRWKVDPSKKWWQRRPRKIRTVAEAAEAERRQKLKAMRAALERKRSGR